MEGGVVQILGDSNHSLSLGTAMASCERHEPNSELGARLRGFKLKK